MRNDGMAEILDGVAAILNGVAKTLRGATPPEIVTPDPGVILSALDADRPLEAEVIADETPPMKLLPCEEATRQANDPERRALLERDPVEWMVAARYYCSLLQAAHQRAEGTEARVEDLVRSVEALPGHADKRIHDLATANVQKDIDAYIDEWIGAHGSIAINKEVGRIDLDHQQRLLYKIGGEPHFYDDEEDEAA